MVVVSILEVGIENHVGSRTKIKQSKDGPLSASGKSRRADSGLAVVLRAVTTDRFLAPLF